MKREPVLIATAIVAVAAVFGVDMPLEATIATVAGILGAGTYLRSLVSPVA